MKTKIINGRIITPDGIREGSIVFGEKILTDDTVADCVIDAHGLYVSPGFIDIHVHGGGGYDFMDGTDEAFEKIAAFHASHGTTAMCPTTPSGDFGEIMQVIDAYRHTKAKQRNGSDFIGLHLEGPYFALSQKGAQDEKYVHEPRREEYERVLNACDDIVRWSAAPELDSGYEFAAELQKRGIMVSAAHTDADCRQMLDAAKHGYTHMTHFYSCMKGVTRVNGIRIAGAIEAAYIDDNITVELIADGMHLPHELLYMVWKLKGTEKTALITDAMRGAGFPDGTTARMGSLKNGILAYIEDGVAKLPDRQAFAGSVATTDRLVRNMLAAGVPLIDTVRMASEIPAKLIGCPTKGVLKSGYDADLLLFDSNIQISRIFIDGHSV